MNRASRRQVRARVRHLATKQLTPGQSIEHHIQETDETRLVRLDHILGRLRLLHAERVLDGLMVIALKLPRTDEELLEAKKGQYPFDSFACFSPGQERAIFDACAAVIERVIVQGGVARAKKRGDIKGSA